ncbi:MAG TPA: hypothetical protein VGK84_02400 [Candidatus Tumulicola sp.]
MVQPFATLQTAMPPASVGRIDSVETAMTPFNASALLASTPAPNGLPIVATCAPHILGPRPMGIWPVASGSMTLPASSTETSSAELMLYGAVQIGGPSLRLVWL